MITCKTFKGGYCEKVKVHVDKNYCERLCPNYPKDLKFPNGITQAKNFAKAVGKRIKNRKNRTGKELERVREICKSCEAYYEKGILPRCKHCGCCTALKTKWESEDCPLGKWNLK